MGARQQFRIPTPAASPKPIKGETPERRGLFHSCAKGAIRPESRRRWLLGPGARPASARRDFETVGEECAVEHHFAAGIAERTG